VAAFLDRRIGFLDIVATVSETLERMSAGGDLRGTNGDAVERALQVDGSARRVAAEVASRWDPPLSDPEGLRA
jgi:1-deoxy-D-xylulose-5-phosphate reductoisomerase